MNKTARIEVFSKVFDSRAEMQKKKLLQLNKKIASVFLVDVYTIDKSFSDKDLQKITSALSNPVTQSFVLRPSTSLRVKKFEWAIEIGFLPGVTDNVGATAREAIEDMLKVKFGTSEGVYSSQTILVNGEISEKEAFDIAKSLYNPLIQRVQCKSFEVFEREGGMDIIIPQVNLHQEPQVDEINLAVSDEELVKIGKTGIANRDGTRRGPLALNLTYMKTIQSYFKKLGRKPTDIELESIAQTWSEHCKHTIFADPIDEIEDGLFKTYIKGATERIRQQKGKQDFCVSVFSDNSGAIAFDENYLITHKVETHNSPSALDPFGGAVTGIVGVNRDTIGFGLGAKPVANFYGYCFASTNSKVELFKDKEKTQPMLSSRRIMDGVIAGVNAGGNQSGIPTPQGFVYFDERYRGKPLVFVGTVGLIPRKIGNKLSHEKNAQPGDYIVMVGGRVGKDGIHGATFSSEAMSSGSPATAVQLGDPITQKKLSDAIVKEARDLLLYNSITDNGAGGLSCSVAEMAKESGGCEVDLDKVPLKYPHLEPWEIWVSESQERMTLAIPPKNWKKFYDLMRRRRVEATVIGEFTDSGKCVVNFKSKKIMDIDLEFLHNGLPKRLMKTRKPTSYSSSVALAKSRSSSRLPLVARTIKDANEFFLQMLGRLNIASYEFISQQYDHIVQGNAMLGPLQGKGRVNADTSVIRPVLSSKKGVIMSQALYPTYTEIDAYKMAAASIDTAIRNAVAAGGNPEYLALLDNFCWCSGNEPERLYQLKEAVRACYDYAVEYGTPFISGKDSMFNDFKGFDKNGDQIKISALPTLLITSFGVIDDINKTISLDAKFSGDLVYLLGETFEELGGSEYVSLLGESDFTVPRVDLNKNKKLYEIFYQAVQKDLIASAVSVGRGGLAVALARKAIGGKLGMNIDLGKLPGKVSREDLALYSESQGRILVSIAPENKTLFEKTFADNTCALIGKIVKEPMISVKGLAGNEIINVSLNKVAEVYRETFKDY